MNPQISTAIILALVAVAAFNSWISRINQFFFFSCSVSPEFASTPRARLITRSYLKGVWLGFSASMLVLGGAMLWTQLSATLCLGAALAVECFCCCAAFARAHRKAGAAIVESAAFDETTGHVAVQEPGLVSVPLLDPGAFTKPMHLALVLAPLFAIATWLIPMAVMHINFERFDAAIAANHADFLSGMGMGIILASLLLYVQLRYLSRNRTAMARFTARGCVLLAWLGSASMAVGSLSVPLHLVITHEIRAILLGSSFLLLFCDCCTDGPGPGSFLPRTLNGTEINSGGGDCSITTRRTRLSSFSIAQVPVTR